MPRWNKPVVKAVDEQSDWPLRISARAQCPCQQDGCPSWNTASLNCHFYPVSRSRMHQQQGQVDGAKLEFKMRKGEKLWLLPGSSFTETLIRLFGGNCHMYILCVKWSLVRDGFFSPNRDQVPFSVWLRMEISPLLCEVLRNLKIGFVLIFLPNMSLFDIY